MKRNLVSLFVVAIWIGMLLSLSGCPGAAVVTFTFPGGVTCTNAMISITATAVAFGGGTTRGELSVEVCVNCAGTPVAGAQVNLDLSGFAEVPLPSGVSIPPTDSGTTDATGCYKWSLPLRNIEDETLFKDIRVPYVVKDASTPSQEIESGTVTVTVTE